MPADLRTHLAILIARVGPTPLFPSADENFDGSVRDDLAVSYLYPGSKEGMKESLTFKLKVKPGPRDFTENTLWYNPDSLTPIKRVWTFRCDEEDVHVEMTETYQEFTLNADIPDEKFKMPEKESPAHLP